MLKNCNVGNFSIFQMNPSRTLLATGGLYPSDIAVYSLPDFQPVAIGEGHHDWLFDVDWLGQLSKLDLYIESNPFN